MSVSMQLERTKIPEHTSGRCLKLRRRWQLKRYLICLQVAILGCSLLFLHENGLAALLIEVAIAFCGYKLITYNDALFKAEERLIQEEQARSVVLRMRGEAYIALGRNSSALEDFTASIESDRENAWAYYRRGSLYLEEGNYESAIVDFTIAVDLVENNPLLLIKRGDALVRLGRKSDAEFDFSAAIGIASKSEDFETRSLAYCLRGTERYKSGDLKGALNDFTNAQSSREQELLEQANDLIRLYPDDGEGYFDRGEALVDKGELDTAIKDYSRAIERYLRKSEEWCDVCDIDENCKHNIRAKDYAATCYARRGGCHQRLQRYDEALDDFSKAIGTSVDDAWRYHLDRADVYDEMKEYKKALADCLAAMELNGRHPDCFYKLGYAQYRIGQYDQAVRNFDTVVESMYDSSDPRIYMYRGQAYEKLGEPHKAMENYDRAVRCLKRDSFGDVVAESYRLRGDAYQRAGDQERAAQDYQKAASADPKISDNYRRKREVDHLSQLIQKQKKPALQYFQRANEYFELGEFEKAVSDFSRSLEIGIDADYSIIQFFNAFQKRLLNEQPKNEIKTYIEKKTSARKIQELPEFLESQIQLIKKELKTPRIVIAGLNKLTASDPNNPEYYIRRARAFRQMAKWKEALQDCNTAINLVPKEGWIYRMRSEILYILERKVEAIADLFEALQLVPHFSIEKNEKRKESYRTKGDARSKIEYLNESIKEDEDEGYRFIFTSLTARAEQYAIIGDLERAEADFERAIASSRNDNSARLSRADFFLKIGEFDRAIEDFSRIIHTIYKGSDCNSSFVRRGRAFFKQCKYKDAIDDFERAIDQEIDDDELYDTALILAGRAFDELGQSIEAQASYRKVITRKRHRSEVFSINYYNRKLALSPEDEDYEPRENSTGSLLNRGEAHLKLGDYGSAIKDFSECIKIKPDYLDAVLSRGHCYLLDGQFKKALADFELIIESNEDYSDSTLYDALVLCGETYKISGELEQALNILGRAIAFKPTHAWAYLERGAVYQQQGDHGKAISDFNECIRLIPTESVCYWMRGDAQAALGNVQAAIEDYSVAIVINEEDAETYQRRACLLNARGDVERAFRDLLQSTDILAWRYAANSKLDYIGIKNLDYL